MASVFEFTIDGEAFRAERLSAIAQFQLSRKLAPLLPPLAPLFMRVAGGKKLTADDALSLIELAQPFAAALSALPDEVAVQLMDMTLASVKVQSAPGTFIPLWLVGAGKAMKTELDDFGKLLPIMLRVVQLNLGPFISGFLTSHEEPAATTPSGDTSPGTKTGS